MCKRKKNVTLVPNLDELIDKTNLSAYQKNYFKKRYCNLLLESYNKYHANRKMEERLGLVTLIGGIIVSAAIGIQQFKFVQENEYTSLTVFAVTFILSIFVNIATGIDQQFYFDEKAKIYNKFFHDLDTRGFQFLGNTGHYKGTNWGDSFVSFCDDIEKINKKAIRDLLSVDDDDNQTPSALTIISNGDGTDFETATVLHRDQQINNISDP